MELLPSGLPESVGEEEDLARFLTSSSQYTASAVRHTVFLPNPRNFETSVFRHGAEPRDQLWEIGDQQIRGERPVHGAAVVKTSHIRAVALEVLASEPPPRHANILGWPRDDSDPDVTKARQKELALKMAAVAILIRRAG